MCVFYRWKSRISDVLPEYREKACTGTAETVQMPKLDERITKMGLINIISDRKNVTTKRARRKYQAAENI